MSTNGLRMVYSQFYRWATATCPGDGEYHCENARCIKAALRCDGINHCGDATDEICTHHIEEFSKGDSFDLSGLIALVIGVCGLIILLIATTTIMSRIYRRSNGSNGNLIGQQQPRRRSRAISPFDLSNPETTAPSIQTVGERRFYVVPENQISVIEAPPCYNDALKHPAVPSGGHPRSYVNQAFARNDSSDPLSAPASPPPFDEVVPSSGAEIPEQNRSTSSSSTYQTTSPEPRGDVPEDPSSMSIDRKSKKPKIREDSPTVTRNNNVVVQVGGDSEGLNDDETDLEDGRRRPRHEESWV
ncbi:hypothetical protein WR25_03463 [Diploscapter pachys]|uniref:Low-density lipoprotein receptor domain class A n=1 Tax=Diploscapter pachys TaxID=2018661 RepID=A0A2A2LAJ2_9BILA|nr:hypothetical protein WR25_03463 [Diploscapter pachys]